MATSEEAARERLHAAFEEWLKVQSRTGGLVEMRNLPDLLNEFVKLLVKVADKKPQTAQQVVELSQAIAFKNEDIRDIFDAMSKLAEAVEELLAAHARAENEAQG